MAMPLHQLKLEGLSPPTQVPMLFLWMLMLSSFQSSFQSILVLLIETNFGTHSQFTLESQIGTYVRLGDFVVIIGGSSLGLILPTIPLLIPF